jgi:hypothetical protein
LEIIKEKKLGYWRNHNRMKLTGPVARECGRIALIDSIGLHTHDPLAHVLQNIVEGDTAMLEEQMYIDFVTDIAERDPDAPFNGQFSFEVQNERIMTAGGHDLEDMITRGLEASRQVAINNPDRQYGVLREESQAAHVADILCWYLSGSEMPLMIASLCPPQSEASDRIAKANGFKTDKQMASMWVYAKSPNGIEMSAFSLDNLDLAGLRSILQQLHIDDAGQLVKSTTLEQLGVPILLPRAEDSQLAANRVIALHDKAFMGTKQGRRVLDKAAEANSRVRDRPEVYQLYKTARNEIKSSLLDGKVSNGLRRMSNELSKGVAISGHITKKVSSGHKLSIDDAREFMDYLRSQVIPQYVFGSHGIEGESIGYDYGDFAGSGADAVSSGKSYDGACPDGDFGSVKEVGSLQDSGLLFGLSIVSFNIEKVSKPNGRGNCTACPEKSTTLFGCGFCTGCNKVWCEEYKNKGKMLSIKDVAAIRKTTGKKTTNKSKLTLKNTDKNNSKNVRGNKWY